MRTYLSADFAADDTVDVVDFCAALESVAASLGIDLLGATVSEPDQPAPTPDRSYEDDRCPGCATEPGFACCQDEKLYGGTD